MVCELKTCRINKDLDLPVLLDWYKHHGWDHLTEEIFPSTGFIVPDHAAMWLFKDSDNVMGWVAWQVINPRKNTAMAFKALHLILDRIDQEAEALNLRILKQTVSHSSLKKLALNHNYLVAEENMTSFVKVI